MNTLPRMSLFEAMTAPIFEREKREQEAKDEPPKPVRTYSVVRDGNDGYGVRCDQTHHFVNEIPIETEAKANRFAEELEERER